MYPRSGEEWKSDKHAASKNLTSIGVSVVHTGRKKGVINTGIQETKSRKLGGNFRRTPITEFGSDAAHSFIDHTTGVGGTGMRSQWARWRSGTRRSSAGYTETGIVEKTDLDIITTEKL